MRHSKENKRHILIALLGRTPQVLTETLYALCVDNKIPVQEIWAVSTQEGRQAAMEKLLNKAHGQFYQLQKDYPQHCGRVRFSAEHILVAQDGLLPLADIRNRQDSETFLELILRVLWEKTSDAKTVLHCSLAGGRKTMSTYMALVMQMLGREQDKLYHVLLTPPEAENHADFYYPTPGSRRLKLRNGSIINSARVKVELVEIPYVRLREKLPIELLDQRASVVELLQWAREQISALPQIPTLRLFPKRCLVCIGQHEIVLPPIQFCLYWHFAERSWKRSRKVPREAYESYFERLEGSAFLSETSLRDLLAKYRAVSSATGMVARFERALQHDKGLPLEKFLQYLSKINRQLDDALTEVETTELYRISAVGRYGKCYGIKLDGRLIRMEEIL